MGHWPFVVDSVVKEAERDGAFAVCSRFVC